MRIAVPHNTTREMARARVEAKIDQLIAQFGGQAEDVDHYWMGDTMKFKGKARGLSVEGTVEITETAVIVDSKLPLIAMPFEGRIRQAVEREADAIFRA